MKKFVSTIFEIIHEYQELKASLGKQIQRYEID
jgi:hypothetical protein